mmetsp:Transcript_139296/g.240736  ORF Transcript_139296/g.240736 Transcript_139296/m.240736 type:complete len:87 (-) Transcript_139296:37-297(-)
MVNAQTGMCSSIGFVNFMDHTVAQTAIATLNGTMLPDGSFLTVKPKGPPKDPSAKGAGGKGKDGGKDFSFDTGAPDMSSMDGMFSG